MKVASRRPLFTVSTMVGKSVKRCDSKRVAAARLRRVVGDRAGQVAGDGQEAHGQRLARASAGSVRRPRDRQGFARSTPRTTTAARAPSPQRSKRRSHHAELLPGRPRAAAGSTSDSRPELGQDAVHGLARPRAGWRARGRGTREPHLVADARRAARTARARGRRAAPPPRCRGSRARPCAAARAAAAPARRACAGGSGSRGTRTARPSAGGRCRRRAPGPAPRAGACRPRAGAGSGPRSPEADEADQVAGRRAARARPRPARGAGPARTFSPTVSQGKRPSCWKTMRTRPARSHRARARPQPARAQVQQRRLAAAGRARRGPRTLRAAPRGRGPAGPRPRRRRGVTPSSRRSDSAAAGRHRS